MHLTKNTRYAISVGLLLGGITLAAFWPVTNHDFINFDDGVYVYLNAHVRGGLNWQSIQWAFANLEVGLWHPLTWMSHMLDCQWFGPRPGGHHLTSLVLHTANTLLLFVVLLRMTGALWRCALVAVLFGLHPLHAESVAWVAERKDVLSTFFVLLTLWAYHRYTQLRSREIDRPGSPLMCHLPSALSYLLCVVLFVFALMSKPIVVTLPLVLLLLDYWPLKRLPSAAFVAHPSMAAGLLLEKLPLLTAGLLISLVTLHGGNRRGALPSVANCPIADRVCNATLSYGGYLLQAFWPRDLGVYYPLAATFSPWSVAGVALLLLGTSVTAVCMARRAPYIVVGWVWYLVALLPVIGLIQLGRYSHADRYTYVPLTGVFVLLAWGAHDLSKKWRYHAVALSIAGSAVVVACFALTRQQLGYWMNSETLFRHTLDVTRDNCLAHNNLGLALLNQGKVDEAISHYETALRISPLYADAHGNLGRALAEKGRYREALIHFETALSLQPEDVKTRNNLGSVLVQLGRHEEAVRQFEEVVRLKPDHAGARNNLAISCKKLGRVGEAITHYREAIRLEPDVLEPLNNLAWLLAAYPDPRFRNGPEAMQLATRACELTQYRNPVPLATLAAAYAETGRFDEAVSFAEQAQDLARGSQGPLATRLEAMLEAFRAGHPYHAD